MDIRLLALNKAKEHKALGDGSITIETLRNDNANKYGSQNIERSLHLSLKEDMSNAYPWVTLLQRKRHFHYELFNRVFDNSMFSDARRVDIP